MHIQTHLHNPPFLPPPGDPVAISGIFNNMYLLLHDQESESYEDDRGFKILIHDPRDDPVIDLRTHGTTLMEGWVKDVRVAVREVRTLSPGVLWPGLREWMRLFTHSWLCCRTQSSCALYISFNRT